MQEKDVDVEVVKAEEGEIFDIELEEDILKRNSKLAEENRSLLDRYGVTAIDVMGAIGSGKTALIEALAERLKSRYKIAMIAGDVTTTIDSMRVRRHGVETVQVNTGKECHLDANLINKALRKLDLNTIDLLFIENVGNLICPAEFDLGAHKRIVVVSVTEGEHMVVKHPYIFLASDVAVINKIDLAEAMGVDPDKLCRDAEKIKPSIKVVKVSVKQGSGIEEVIKALDL
ncbi:hydrogenase accessory protein HypB [Candidatus Bathyarchaeota archaeon B24-2]|nr:MAG: hydrogenase accessory protein HypB [Candidatus Bathyarchaeota archaeon B24-2]